MCVILAEKHGNPLRKAPLALKNEPCVGNGKQDLVKRLSLTVHRKKQSSARKKRDGKTGKEGIKPEDGKDTQKDGKDLMHNITPDTRICKRG